MAATSSGARHGHQPWAGDSTLLYVDTAFLMPCVDTSLGQILCTGLCACYRWGPNMASSSSTSFSVSCFIRCSTRTPALGWRLYPAVDRHCISDAQRGSQTGAVTLHCALCMLPLWTQHGIIKQSWLQCQLPEQLLDMNTSLVLETLLCCLWTLHFRCSGLLLLAWPTMHVMIAPSSRLFATAALLVFCCS